MKPSGSYPELPGLFAFIKEEEGALQYTQDQATALAIELIHRAVEAGDIDYVARGYAEPGYGPSDYIVFANWNAETKYDSKTSTFHTIDATMEMLGEVAEWLGYGLQWLDEWAVCSCGRAFRTQGDSYHWTMYGFMDDEYGEVICGECVNKDPTFYLESIAGNPNKAVTIQGLKLSDHGFAKVNFESFESGMYGGQNDNPKAIAETLNQAGITDFVFSIDSVGQFDAKFSVWVPSDQLEAASYALEHGVTQGPDPAVEMERALRTGEGMVTRQIDSEQFAEHGLTTLAERAKKKKDIEGSRRRSRYKR